MTKMLGLTILYEKNTKLRTNLSKQDKTCAQFSTLAEGVLVYPVHLHY
jgi:hypothetical protein